MPKFIVKISDENDDILSNIKNIECYVLSANIKKTSLQRLINQLLSTQKTVLLEGDAAADLCMELGADGIVADLSQSNSIKKDMSILRKKIGSTILGVVSRNRRHEAMVASENEPDFIVFKVWNDGKEKTIELSKWYSELFLLPQVIELSDDVNYEDYNADMVILSPNQYKILVAEK